MARAESQSRQNKKADRLEHFVYDQPGHLIRRANQRAWALFREETAALDVMPEQFALLVAVADVPAIDATRLSELICIDRATIGNIVGRLENKGLLVRQPDSRDKRVKRLHITPAGQQLVAEVCQVRTRIRDRMLSPLTADEADQFMHMLRKLVGIEAVKRRARDPEQ